MTTTMRIERARDTRRNRKALLSLIDEASAWLRTKDTDQWAEPWPTRRKRDKRVRRDLADGKTWFVWDGNTLAATVTIAEQHNPYVWSGCECDLSEPAAYVHRLITARKYAGLGLGAELTDWAGMRGRLLYGARWIRIDVWTSNSGLHQYYKMAGFESCGWCTDPGYPSGALFQKPVSEIGPLAIPHVTGLSAEFDYPAAPPAMTPSSSREASCVPGSSRLRGQVNDFEDMVCLPSGYSIFPSVGREPPGHLARKRSKTH
jgi:GNAT superfamily N-acetyltransferase